MKKAKMIMLLASSLFLAGCGNNSASSSSADHSSADHVHEYKAAITNPTCTKAGFTTYTCTVCQDSYVADQIDALGHDIVYHEAAEATCTEEGHGGYEECRRCSDYTTKGETTPALGHSFEDHFCIRCGEPEEVTQGIIYKLNTYTYSGTTTEYYTVTGFTGSGGAVYVPSTYKDVPVLRIDDYAFAGSGITSVAIGEGVVSIGYRSFYNCASLTSVTIPDSVTSIDDYSFYKCYELATLSIGSGLSSIPNYAFAECPKLTNLTVDNSTALSGVLSQAEGLTDITLGNNITTLSLTLAAYDSAETLKTFVIGDHITSIGSSVFKDCVALESVTIPDSVATIGSNAFDGCESLKSLAIPSSVTSISSNAFLNCAALESISCDERNEVYYAEGNCLIKATVIESDPEESEEEEETTETHRSLVLGCKNSVIPTNVDEIASYAFWGCTGLTSLSIPANVEQIRDYAFFGCSGLTAIAIPDGVHTIGYYAFAECSGATSISIPDSVSSLTQTSFYLCESVTTLDYDSDVGLGSLLGQLSGLKTLNIGANVTTLDLETREISGNTLETISVASGNTSFSSEGNCVIVEDSTLETKTVVLGCEASVIPNDVTHIGDRAFANCAGLTSITIPEGVTEIGDDAFSGCESLASITISSTVTSIGDYAFSHCGALESVVIPDSVTSIGNYAFSGCSSLESIDIGNGFTSSGSIATTAFSDCIYLDTLICDSSAVLSNLVNQINVLRTVVIGDSVNSISSYAFQSKTYLKNVTIGSGVTSIGTYAFSGCRSLETIVIPSTVTRFYNYAFQNCTSIEKVYYGGTSTEWNSITKGSSNTYLTSATRYYFTENGDAETAEGNWWYYNATTGAIVEKVVEAAA